MAETLRDGVDLGPHLDDGFFDCCENLGSKPNSDSAGIQGLAADQTHNWWQHAERLGEHQSTTGCGQMHVGEEVLSLGPAETCDVDHFWIDHENGARGFAPIDSVDDDQRVPSRLEFLDEGNAGDPRLDDLDAIREGHGLETSGDLHAETVIAAQHVAHACDQQSHDRAVLVTVSAWRNA